MLAISFSPFEDLLQPCHNRSSSPYDTGSFSARHQTLPWVETLYTGGATQRKDSLH
ncbi:hypothetical protein SESBI_00539 [Sesbania bispinosa]|nr:hypothetical protein SESBI_00539 [Sesbania bispinosa]